MAAKTTKTTARKSTAKSKTTARKSTAKTTAKPKRRAAAKPKRKPVTRVRIGDGSTPVRMHVAEAPAVTVDEPRDRFGRAADGSI